MVSSKENFYFKVEVNQLKSQNYSLLNEINNLRNKINLLNYELNKSEEKNILLQNENDCLRNEKNKLNLELNAMKNKTP